MGFQSLPCVCLSQFPVYKKACDILIDVVSHHSINVSCGSYEKRLDLGGKTDGDALGQQILHCAKLHPFWSIIMKSSTSMAGPLDLIEFTVNLTKVLAPSGVYLLTHPGEEMYSATEYARKILRPFLPQIVSSQESIRRPLHPYIYIVPNDQVLAKEDFPTQGELVIAETKDAIECIAHGKEIIDSCSKGSDDRKAKLSDLFSYMNNHPFLASREL